MFFPILEDILPDSIEHIPNVHCTSLKKLSEGDVTFGHYARVLGGYLKICITAIVLIFKAFKTLCLQIFEDSGCCFVLPELRSLTTSYVFFTLMTWLFPHFFGLNFKTRSLR